VESVLGVVTAVTSESIGAVVSVSPSDSSDSSVPPSIPSSFEDEVLQLTIPIINQNNTNTILLCVIFFTDKKI